MLDPEIIREIKDRYLAVSTQMDERSRRRWAAAESQLFGWGGISAVSKATGISPNTIRKGVAELSGRLDNLNSQLNDRVRKPGAGRKPLTVTSPELMTALDRLFCDSTPQDACRFIKWSCKSPAELAAELSQSGLIVSPRTISRILKSAGFHCPTITRSKAALARSAWSQRFLEINERLDQAFTHQQPVITISARRRKLDETSADNVALEFQTAGTNGPFDHVEFNDPQQAAPHPSRTYRRQSGKQPQMKLTDQVLKEMEAAIKGAWKSIDEQTRLSKSELLILTEFFLGDPVLRRMEMNLNEELKLPIRCLSLPPAIRKWNPLKQEIASLAVECIGQEIDFVTEMTLQVIGCSIPKPHS